MDEPASLTKTDPFALADPVLGLYGVNGNAHGAQMGIDLDQVTTDPTIPELAQLLGRAELGRKESAQGGVFGSDDAMYVLGVLDRDGFLPASELEEMASGYTDWRAIFMLVRAGFASDSLNGLVPTDEGRRVAAEFFEQDPV